MMFYSEFGEDSVIDALSILPERGIYVDIGCAWPDLRSNTAFLRDRGWAGLAIDGNPFWKPYWDQVPNAKFINALVSDQPSQMFSTDGPPDMARISEIAPLVQCRTLESLLVENWIEHIDLLSLDCEGHEFNALMSMNIARHAPTVIISEFNTAGIGEDYQVRDYLVDVGYEVVYQTIANLIYLRK